VKNKQSYPACPSCGSTDFYVDGFVGYQQPYDAKTDEYSISEVFWEEDYATGARCAQCDKDVTYLFKKHDVVGLFRASFRNR